MKYPVFISLRYLFSKKSNNLINIITKISVVVIAVASASLVLILSVMNGMNDLVEQLYSNFSPDIIVQPSEGKSFTFEDLDEATLLQFEEVEYALPTKEAVVLLKYDEQQEVATLKGVSNNYLKAMGMDNNLADPVLLQENHNTYSILGIGLAYKLGISRSYNPFVTVYAPGTQNGSMLNSESYFRSSSIENISTFSVSDEFDTKYMLVHHDFVSQLMKSEGRFNAFEIQLKEEVNPDKFKVTLQESLGTAFSVKTRFEQHEFLFRSLNSEKWVALLVLSFIMMIAFFNLTGSLIMLMIDKKQDVMTLKAMGVPDSRLKRIFFLEGIGITSLGALLGVTIGSLLVAAQNYFEIVKVQGSFVISAYPVKWEFLDILLILLIVVSVGVIASWIPTRKIYRS